MREERSGEIDEVRGKGKRDLGKGSGKVMRRLG
jgi:hypothetical protein